MVSWTNTRVRMQTFSLVFAKEKRRIRASPYVYVWVCVCLRTRLYTPMITIARITTCAAAAEAEVIRRCRDDLVLRCNLRGAVCADVSREEVGEVWLRDFARLSAHCARAWEIFRRGALLGVVFILNFCVTAIFKGMRMRYFLISVDV